MLSRTAKRVSQTSLEKLEHKMAETADDSPLTIQMQYVKDLSFENPNAPQTFTALGKTPPEVQVNIDVTPAHLTERLYEIVLSLRVTANVAQKPAFLVELDYAGIATVGKSVSEADMEPLLLAEVPRHLFPFARGVLATVTRDGGFPPFLLTPINFQQFYLTHKKGALTATTAAAAAPSA